MIDPAFREQLARAVATVNQRTPFARNYEGLILDAVEGLLGRSLPRPLYATPAPAPVSTVDWALVQQAPERFRVRVALRRLRPGRYLPSSSSLSLHLHGARRGIEEPRAGVRKAPWTQTAP